MLSIGEFSNICKVSTKTLRYYDEIGLLKPSEINPENGYRYYSIEQLERMLFINRLKSYSFSLEEIKEFIRSDEKKDDSLHEAFTRKKKQLENELNNYSRLLSQLEEDITAIEQGKSVMSYMDDIDVQLVDMSDMNLLYIRKNVMAEDFPMEYSKNYEKLFKRIAIDRLKMTGAPMVLFHSSEYTPSGLDTEFAIPIEEYVTGTRDFSPGLCLKTVVRGEYSELSSVYTRQIEWAEKEGYKCTNALFEVYVTDPSQVERASDNITEVYYPVRKIKD
jgi:DNA-binding transcriptional MerR regulator